MTISVLYAPIKNMTDRSVGILQPDNSAPSITLAPGQATSAHDAYTIAALVVGGVTYDAPSESFEVDTPCTINAVGPGISLQFSAPKSVAFVLKISAPPA